LLVAGNFYLFRKLYGGSVGNVCSTEYVADVSIKHNYQYDILKV
jgi:hypothetical protein